jgi:GTP-binding protein
VFIDQATINVKAGNGGNGVVSFRREKFIPKGGPDGGNGGSGGSVILRADRQLTTLMDFRYKRKYAAGDGDKGGGANRTGRSAEDIVIRIPLGTVIRDEETGELCADMVTEGEEVVIARGGKGGKGNA